MIRNRSARRNGPSHPPAALLRRGIDPGLLLEQIQNTMPYLFADNSRDSRFDSVVPAQIVKEFRQAPSSPLSHFQYFQLCLSAHYLTCGTPVPTDVDNQIRYRLWPEHLSLEEALLMAQFVLDSRSWNFQVLSTRFIEGLNGHLGEWFTVSAAAYGALQRYSDPVAQRLRQALFDSISDEIRSHSEVFGTFWKDQRGLDCLKASAIIAHNFGDLDRVMDLWEISAGDPLRLKFYKLTSLPFDSNRELRYLGRLWVAGELYKSTISGSSMAFENHRHFALRKPRCLRQNPDFLIPMGPFLDHWGSQVARGLADIQGAATDKTFEIVAALRQGWDRLPKTVGYGRALHGILEVHPHLPLDRLEKIPSFNAQLEMPQELFEKQWAEAALKLMDEIPSRA